MSRGLRTTRASEMMLRLKMVITNFRKNGYKGLSMPSNHWEKQMTFRDRKNSKVQRNLALGNKSDKKPTLSQ